MLVGPQTQKFILVIGFGLAIKLIGLWFIKKALEGAEEP
jgi:hypothetical protein